MKGVCFTNLPNKLENNSLMFQLLSFFGEHLGYTLDRFVPNIQGQLFGGIVCLNVQMLAVFDVI